MDGGDGHAGHVERVQVALVQLVQLEPVVEGDRGVLAVQQHGAVQGLVTGRHSEGDGEHLQEGGWRGSIREKMENVAETSEEVKETKQQSGSKSDRLNSKNDPDKILKLSNDSQNNVNVGALENNDSTLKNPSAPVKELTNKILQTTYVDPLPQQPIQHGG